jgi:hypothetical protein
VQALRIGDHDGLGRDDHTELDLCILGMILDVAEGAVLVVRVMLRVGDLEFVLCEEVDVLGRRDGSDCGRMSVWRAQKGKENPLFKDELRRNGR